MSKLTFSISMSLDGFIAGPNASREEPLGEGGGRLHEWVYGLRSWREPHGLEGGTTVTGVDVIDEAFNSLGAAIMGKRMFCGEDGPWGDEPFEGWWGDDPPFHMPVFVLTNYERPPLVKSGGTTFTFVTDGIESALEQARAVAGDKDVGVSGGANVAQQYLRAGHLDELQVSVVPLLLGAGTRLFDDPGLGLRELEPIRVVDTPTVTHVKYRVVK
jgi:dihydrofolate reductase